MTSPDRWSCPRCGRTIALCGPLPPSDLLREIRGRQARHEAAHSLADDVQAALSS